MSLCVTISTIPSRLNSINLTLNSINQQTIKPDKIFLNIPYSYIRFPNETIDEKELKKIKSENVEITRCADFGPGTKIMGSLEKIRKYDAVVILDDDHIYDSRIIEIFTKEFKKEATNYSFFLNNIFGIKMGQGADGILINTKYLDKIEIFFEKFVKNNKNLLLDDDFWMSIYLQKIKKTKIKNLISAYREMTGKNIVYKIHSDSNALSKTIYKSGAFLNRKKIAKIEYIKFFIKNFFIKC